MILGITYAVLKTRIVLFSAFLDILKIYSANFKNFVRISQFTVFPAVFLFKCFPIHSLSCAYSFKPSGHPLFAHPTTLQFDFYMKYSLLPIGCFMIFL